MSLDGFTFPAIPARISQMGPMAWLLAVCALVACMIGIERVLTHLQSRGIDAANILMQKESEQ